MFFGICGMKAISINKPNAIFHMTEIDNDIESWIEFEDDPTLFKDGEEKGEGIWNTSIFGKSIGELMEDGIRNKISQMDDECQIKLQDTMQKIVNDSSGGMVCIII